MPECIFNTDTCALSCNSPQILLNIFHLTKHKLPNFHREFVYKEVCMSYKTLTKLTIHALSDPKHSAHILVLYIHVCVQAFLFAACHM